MKVVDTKNISILPKSYEHYLAQSFKWHCELCEELRLCVGEKGHLPFCTHQYPIQIIDSYNHLGSALSKMVSELKSSCSNFKEEISAFKGLYQWINTKYSNRDENTRKEFFTALTQKQFFPYSLLSQIERLQEKQLPPYEDWYDELKKEYTPQENINYAQSVFALFQCDTILDYLEIYLEADVGEKMKLNWIELN